KIGTDTETYVAEDPNGVGAKLSGGRWNHIGKSVVYVAVSRALACLETLVHLKGGSTLPFNRYLVQVTVPKKLWNKATDLDPQNLDGWDALTRGKVSMDWGTQWLDDGKTAIALVPAIIDPEENSVLINPLHRDASQIDYTIV